MSAKRVFKNLARFVATKILRRKTIPFVKMAFQPSENMQRNYFRAVARSEMSKETTISDVEFVVYYGDQKSVDHYKMWNPVFAESAESAGTHISIFRVANSWWPLIDEPNVYPVSSILQLEPLIKRMPNLKAIFYPANNGVNLQAVRNNNLTHVFLGHGDSNKASSANKVFRLYDEIWIAGKAHRERFKHSKGNYSALEFRIVGQPWMRDWFNRLPEYSQKIRNQWAYFPTWSGYFQSANYSSVELIPDISTAAQNCLGNEAAGFLKYHPWSSEKDVQSAQQLIVENQRALATNYNQNEHGIDIGLQLPEQSTQLREILEKQLRFVICDLSAAITECLYINVPIFLYHPAPPVSVPEHFLEQNDFCYVYRNVDELRILLERVITNDDDFLKEKRQKALDYFVDIEKTKANSFKRELDNLRLLK